MQDGDRATLLSRRRMLSQTGAAITAATAAAPALAMAVNDTSADLNKRRKSAKSIRDTATNEATAKPFPMHPTNGDEEKLQPKFIGNFCKGLPQSEFGVVDRSAYEQLLKALSSRDPAEFEKIPLGPLTTTAATTTATPTSQAALRTKQQFYRTFAERTEMMANLPVGHPRPRFYRLHSEQAVTTTGNSALIDPQAALGYDLEDIDSHGFAIDPPPNYESEGNVAEIAENYWMALLRDTPYSQFDTDATVKVAVDHLNSFDPKWLIVPRDPTTGKITPATLFRGGAKGDLIGPYVSQFLLRDIPFGAYVVPQQVQVGYIQITGTDGNMHDPVFLTTASDWYQSQLGQILPEVVRQPAPLKYSYRPRELCNYVHIDELFQGYLNAEIILSTGASRGLGVPLSSGNPYKTSKTQHGFGTLGEPNFAAMVAEVATRALKTVWYQKWAVHRRLRPEAYAGHLHFLKTGAQRDYPLHPRALSMLDPVLQKVLAFNSVRKGDGYFLPMAFQDGCPVHPSYGAGHATVAGACVTLLKACYDETTTFGSLVDSEIVVTDAAGNLITLTQASPTAAGTSYNWNDLQAKMTVGGELDKLVSNISLARNFAGVHWRSDHNASVLLGEQVGIEFLRETVKTYNENVSFSFSKFDGTPVKITKT